MYYVSNLTSECKDLLFPNVKQYYLFDFEPSKSKLIEEKVGLPCYVVLEGESIADVIRAFPKKGSLKILIGIDKNIQVYERVYKGKAEHIEITNRCDIDFALLYQPLNVVEFLFHLHQGSSLNTRELIEECTIYYKDLNEWFFNHKNFFKYNEFFHNLEKKIIDRYKKIIRKGSSVRLLNCDGKELVFIKKNRV